MKLRIKFGKERKSVEILDTWSVLQLLSECKQLFSLTGNYGLSLNGAEEIASSSTDQLSTLELVSGDLLHLIEVDTSMECDTITSSSFSVASATITSQSTTVASTSKTSSSMTVSSTPCGSHVQAQEGDLKVNAKNIPLIAKVLLQDLEKIVECTSDSDHLFVAIHSFMLQHGFTLQQQQEIADANNVQLKLPSTWKNSEMKFYKITYVYAKDLKCDVSASISGSSLLFTGALDHDDSEAHQMKLKISDYVDDQQLSTKQPFLIYKNFEELSSMVEENLINHLKQDAKQVLGNVDASLTTIPYELQFRIVKWLDMQSICALSRVSRNIKLLCNDDALWKFILQRDFDSVTTTGRTYKQTVKSLYRDLKEQERERARIESEERLRPRMPFRPEFEVPPDLVNPYAPRGIPGVIGGAYDLYPAGGFQPGGFPNTPSFGGFPHNPVSGGHQPDILRGRYPPNSLRRPPGARFDPYSPLGEDEFGRPQHPGMMHRPRFNNHDRFGGGGFI